MPTRGQSPRDLVLGAALEAILTPHFPKARFRPVPCVALKVLDCPGACFSTESFTRMSFSPRRTLFRQPDRLGPTPGGIAITFEHLAYCPPGAPPRPEWRDRQGFRECRMDFPSGDGRGLLRVLLQVPAVHPPDTLVAPLVAAFMAHAEAWRLEPSTLPHPVAQTLVSTSRNDPYPGQEASAPLEAILEWGEVHLHPDGHQGLLTWHEPWPQGTLIHVVHYVEGPRGWRARAAWCLEEAPVFQWQKGTLWLRAGSTRTLALPWPQPWQADQSLRARLLAILKARDPQARLFEMEKSGRTHMVGRTHPQFSPTPNPPDGKAAKLQPGPGGLTVTYELDHHPSGSPSGRTDTLEGEFLQT